MSLPTVRACVIVALACVTCAGCSAKAWYGGVQAAAQNECRKQPGGDSDACRARTNTMSYESYERQRTHGSL